MNRETFIAALVAAALSTGVHASSFGPDYGFDEVSPSVERARQAPSSSHPEWLADLIVHEINPRTVVHQPPKPKE